jgi:branched-chain amino acid transport system permease protein
MFKDKSYTIGFIVFVCAFLFFLPALIKNSYFLHVLIVTFLAIIYTVSLRLILVNGLLSFGHGAFAGIGAYASALLMMKAGCPFLLSMPLSGLISAVIGGLIAFPALRVKGAYFVILTWAVGEVFVVTYKRLKGVFGGTSGLYGIPGPNIFGVECSSKLSYFYLALMLMLVTVIVCYRIDKSRFGMIIKGIAISEDLAESVGINLTQYKVFNFSLACFFTGLAGSFLAHYTHFLSPEMFGIALSESIVVFMLVGGGGSLWGAIIGASVLNAVPELLTFTSHYRMAVYGAILILTMIFLPGGIVSLVHLRRIGKPTDRISK